jgi:hypothetical protein
LRRSNPSGVLIGGYGWVENLRLRSSSLESDGFIHAPSVPQAVSAAVLRSGYQSLSGGASNPFAVNLSSARSRLASRLLDRVRASQTVGALTGDEFERNIQESGAGQSTRAFRECAPSSTTFPAGGGPPATIPQPPRLTDGLVLRDKWQAGDSQVAALLAQIESDDQQRRQNGQPALAPVVTVALGMLEDAIERRRRRAHGRECSSRDRRAAQRRRSTRSARTRRRVSARARLPDQPTPPAYARPSRRLRGARERRATARVERAKLEPVASRGQPDARGLVESWLPDPREVRCTAPPHAPAARRKPPSSTSAIAI